MFIPIGKITENNKIVGLVTFNTDDYKKHIFTMEEAFDIVRTSNNICGMTPYEKSTGATQVTKSKKYIWNKIPECNGKGIPEDNKTVYTLIGRYIDEKTKKRVYVICDSYGNIKMGDKNSVIEMLESISIIGITKTKNNNINSYIQNFLSDSDMKHLGFEYKEGEWIRGSVDTLDYLKEA